MDRLPPRLVRRLVLAPLALIVSLALLVLSPALLLLAAIADVFLPGNWRTLRLTAFVVAYLAFEVVGLLGMLALWIMSGFGIRMKTEWMRHMHFGFMRWWLKMLNGVARYLFRLYVWIEDRPEPRPGPILVFARHAGPG